VSPIKFDLIIPVDLQDIQGSDYLHYLNVKLSP